eukprot:GHRR01003922.1.p1 GENE.GHRR01003922.1~~GHRR01003922.1.p1  ORF type:complete len:553 (+),score=174.13 GHRR01003922.1:546-2204(+)
MGRAATQQQAPAPALPWMRLPISIPVGSGVPLAQVQGLQQHLRDAVRGQLGFTELFPVQAAVWRSLAGGHSLTHDICICAPTGSGKTLAYAMPMINAIIFRHQQCSHTLSGLVVLPTRDLAIQVFLALSQLGTAAGLRVVLTAAQESVAVEAAKLMSLPGSLSSGPDILVATPGRLMAHLHCTAGFSIKGIRFLVVDEADRLLRQDYQGWLPKVLQELQPPAVQYQQHQQQWQHQQHSTAASTGLSMYGTELPLLPFADTNCRVIKLIVSATLTRDPGKLLRLELQNPRYITLSDMNRRYALPKSLMQYRVVVPAHQKPLALLGLLRRVADSTSMLFASSLETTHRLYLMLAAVPDLHDLVAEYSSHVPANKRHEALVAFKAGTVKVLVTSDAMARGMHMSKVANVINYDPPVHPKTYIHRAGRTARAGEAGSVYTLLKLQDVVHFNSMISKLDGNAVIQLKLPPAELQPLWPALKQALQQVTELLQQGKQQDRQQATGRHKENLASAGQHTKQQQQQQSIVVPADGTQGVDAQLTHAASSAGKKRKRAADS